MATIYRFIVEQKASGGASDSTKPRASKGAGKKGNNLPLFGGSKGGVEHNRKMRAINPILNKVTNGVWEKGMRLTRAGAGLVKNINEKGWKGAFSGPSIAIIVAFVLITVWNGIAKMNQRDRANAAKLNAQNFKAMENGSGTVHGAYSIAVNGWSGHISYNENK
jgi:hypothetical protein